jgi:hypothetical protein
MKQVEALRERTMKMVELVGRAKVSVLDLLDLLVNGCSPLSEAAKRKFSTVHVVVQEIVDEWVDTFGSSATEKNRFQELLKLCGPNQEQEEEEGEDDEQRPGISNNDIINEEQENESTDQIVADSYPE